MRGYESIDARPSTPRRFGFVALALVAGVVALSRTTNLSPAGTQGALFGASIVHPNVTSTVSTHDGTIHRNVTSINSTHNGTLHPNVTSSEPDCMPHCGDSSGYSYSYVDGGSAHSHADDDAYRGAPGVGGGSGWVGRGGAGRGPKSRNKSAVEH